MRRRRGYQGEVPGGQVHARPAHAEHYTLMTAGAATTRPGRGRRRRAGRGAVLSSAQSLSARPSDALSSGRCADVEASTDVWAPMSRGSKCCGRSETTGASTLRVQRRRVGAGIARIKAQYPVVRCKVALPCPSNSARSSDDGRHGDVEDRTRVSRRRADRSAYCAVVRCMVVRCAVVRCAVAQPVRQRRGQR